MSYDRLAPFYTLLETLVFGRVLQEARCVALGGEAPEKVLVIGDGNGRFLAQAVKAWPETRFVSIDASEGMLELAKGRVGDARVRFIHADVLAGIHQIQGETFDVIVTHFFLDCLPEETLAELIPLLARMRTPSGVWEISDFSDQKLPHRAMLWVMYRFFHTFTETLAQRLPDFGSMLRAQGLTPQTLGRWRSGFLVAQRWR